MKEKPMGHHINPLITLRFTSSANIKDIMDMWVLYFVRQNTQSHLWDVIYPLYLFIVCMCMEAHMQKPEHCCGIGSLLPCAFLG